MVQSNTAAAAVLSMVPLSDRWMRMIFLGMALLVGLTLLGGVKRIGRVTELLIPAMAVFYIGGCLVILLLHPVETAAAFTGIFAEAFGVRSAFGGAAGYGISQAVRVGVTRGVFTNEAGLGSAPIAHAAAESESPAKQGLWGIFEVFFDTIVMCTMTGLVILISGVSQSGSSDGAALTLSAFRQYLGSFAAVLVGISTFFFALATIIGWSYYGESCVRWLFPCRGAVQLYRAVYTACVYFGAMTHIDLVWGLADFCNSLMMIPNLYGVLLGSGVVAEETKSLRREKAKRNITKSARKARE